MKKNKIVKIFIVIVLLLNMQIPVIAVTTGVVNVETVRVRGKATTDSDIVELVSIGDKITITGEEGNWYKVKVGNIVGYIRKDLLTVEGGYQDPEGNDTGLATETPGVTEEPNEEMPNEKTPTEETPTEKVPDEEVPDEGTSNGEIPVENNSIGTGENDIEISTLKLAEGVTVGKKIKLTEETKIKILPSATSTNIATLNAETEVTVLEVINSWCRVETEGAYGWVRIDQ